MSWPSTWVAALPKREVVADGAAVAAEAVWLNSESTSSHLNSGALRGRTATLFQSLVRILFNILGVLFLLVGCVWFLQGVNILPGSFMTGQTKWAIYGGLLLVAGIGLLVFANRRRRGAV